MNDAAAHALRLLDKILAERPDRVGHDFSEATRCIAAYRDQLVAVWRRTRDEADRRRLGTVNGVLSAVLGGHYPLGPVPWPTIEQARHAFASVVENNGANATS